MNIVDNRFEIWPGSPRNFATEPATWYDFVATAPTGNFRFAIDFTMAANTPGVVFGNSSGSPQIHIAAGSINIQVTIRLFDAAVTTVYINNYEAGKTYHIEIERSGGIATISGDASGSQTGTVATTLSFSPVSSHNGTITKGEMRNASGALVWSYPSESERMRLITTNGNVVARDRYFEAANPAIAARIDSQIDLRGIVSDYTVAVDFEAAQFTANSQKQELAGQGACVSVSGAQAVCSLAYARVTETDYRIQLSHEVAGTRRVSYYQFTAPLSGRHIAAGTINIVGSNTVFCIYLDGVLVKTETMTGIPTGIAYPTAKKFSINGDDGGTWTNFFGKFHNVLLFDRALSTGEIQLLR